MKEAKAGVEVKQTKLTQVKTDIGVLEDF